MRTPRGLVIPDFSFFQRDTVVVAKDLLGHILISSNEGVITGGRIVEVEAYLPNDPACHAFGGMTERNKSMFLGGGVVYVYFIYGVHHCVNIVAGLPGIGTAVLIRALEPLYGTDEMFKRRPKAKSLKDIANGPGKVAQALGLTRADDGANLLKGNVRVFLDPKRVVQSSEIVATKRVGIQKAADRMLRFYIKGDEYVSRR